MFFLLRLTQRVVLTNQTPESGVGALLLLWEQRSQTAPLPPAPLRASGTQQAFRIRCSLMEAELLLRRPTHRTRLGNTQRFKGPRW